jgi:hypothetical protein
VKTFYPLQFNRMTMNFVVRWKISNDEEIWGWIKHKKMEKFGGLKNDHQGC